MKKQCIVMMFVLLFGLSRLDSVQAMTKEREAYEKTGDIFWEARTNKKMVAITFDDGPHSVYTPEILDLLAKYNAKATFFVMGAHAVKFPELIKREFKEGHEVANHTYQHHYGKDNRLKEEINRTSDIIQQLTGERPILFRPVGGLYNDEVVRKVAETGHLVAMWSWHQDTYDWKKPGVQKMVKKVTFGVKPGDIILMHDGGGDRRQTVKALDKILQHLQTNGYEMVTVSELLYRSHSKLPDLIEPFSFGK